MKYNFIIQKFSVLLLIAALLINFEACSESFTDSRDGRDYKTIHVANVDWMAENLNYKTANSFCPDGDERNCKKYGRLYTWTEAKNVCPEGWRLPTNSDFNSLISAAGGMPVAGKVLKSTSQWFKKGNGDDSFDFGGLPAGYRSSEGKFDGIGGYGYYWGADEEDEVFASYLFLEFSSNGANVNSFDKESARSVRCVK